MIFDKEDFSKKYGDFLLVRFLLASKIRPKLLLLLSDSYYDLNAFNTRCSLAQYITPLEEANDDLKDIFYDRKNRVVLDFLNKCFRTTETTRPKAEDLLKHKFFN